MDAILIFFSKIFSNLSWLATLFVAMLPIAEAKVAIPFGMSQEIWGNGALSPVWAAILGFIGSMIPAFFVIPFLKPVFNKLKQTKIFAKIVIFFENIFKSKAQKQEHKIQVHLQKLSEKKVPTLDSKVINLSTNGKKVKPKPQNLKKFKITEMITLLFFVAIPLPLAGVWTSSAIAAFGNMKFWPSILSIALGNLLEVVVVTLLCVLFIDSIGILLIITIVLISVYAILMLIFTKKKHKKQANKQQNLE